MNRLSLVMLVVSALCAGAAPVRAQRGSGFVPEVHAPTQTLRFKYIWPFFQDSNFLGQVADNLNQSLVLPRPVRLAAGECGEVNAFYRPDTDPPIVVMCYEMLELIQIRFNHQFSDSVYAEAQRGALEFVLFHEIGHALVHELSLPITGREEDVADQFATLMFARDHPELPLWAARFFVGVGDEDRAPLDETAFADEHALDEQRFYNILCWTYGASPQDRQDLLRYLPPQRAARCPDEYRQMESAWRTFLSPHGRR